VVKHNTTLDATSLDINELEKDETTPRMDRTGLMKNGFIAT